MKQTKFCVSVIGSDRPGIVSAVTSIFYEVGGNLEDASMTILSGEFAMIFIVSFKNTSKINSLLEKLKVLEKKNKLYVEVRKVSLPRSSQNKVSTIPYLISVFGADRAGIVYRISRALAVAKLNITDLQSKQISSGKKMVYRLLLEVDIPKKFPVGRIQTKLNGIARELRVDLSMKTVESVTL